MSSVTEASPTASNRVSRPAKTATWPAFYVLAYFVTAAVVTGTSGGGGPTSLFLVPIGVVVAGGFAVHARARPARKLLARRLSIALVGTSLFLGAGVFGRQSFQLEGFFFYTLAGIAGGVVVHYLVAKIAGPLFIGRAWCGWGCWIWMVFDYLPWKRSPGRRPGLGWIRVVHFAASLALAAGLVLFAGYDHGFSWTATDGLWWFLGGCGVYYVVGIAMAAALRDNRAFCKYLCPVTVFLRAGARFSLLAIAGSREACTECDACERICPMDVKVRDFVAAGARVSDPECTLCQRCVAACGGRHLHLSLGVPGVHRAPDGGRPSRAERSRVNAGA
jgi:ferredoxin-type protein NapH